MNAIYSLFNTPNSLALLVLRLALGGVFLPHGLQKTFGMFGGSGFSATMQGMSNGMHIPAFFVFLAIAAEFGGALGLIFGFFTRIAAFGIGFTMVVAVAMVHGKMGFFMNWHGSMPPKEGFEYHLLAIGMALALMISGGGLASVDQFIARNLLDRKSA